MEDKLRPWVWRAGFAGVGLLFGIWIGLTLLALAGLPLVTMTEWLPLTWFAWGLALGAIAYRRSGGDAASRVLVVVMWAVIFPPVAIYALLFAKPKVKRPAPSAAVRSR